MGLSTQNNVIRLIPVHILVILNWIDARKIANPVDDGNKNEATDLNETTKPVQSLPKVLAIGQVVLFDAICVIDTAASAVSKPDGLGKDTNKEGSEKAGKINTKIAVKKMIYMIATKVTKMDDSKIGGMGCVDATGKF